VPGFHVLASAEARLPLPLRAENREPRETEYGSARPARARGRAENSAHAGDRGCGCAGADV